MTGGEKKSPESPGSRVIAVIGKAKAITAEVAEESQSCPEWAGSI